eukprot:gnl/MRDRNA2_/MRDRNA2_108571_c0_seq1.p1 gnl/MRDRNA2_/MRDRNA2_108571_c0~~gnl/MRDRNA2_/MRDRNA2_108571_c0_seq1.p1  ORF type:complete len:106 (+),score=21.78 gnl/MRDRNA2_/MRDRNA2_108571_c0_seq1:48-365(+)
MPVQHVVYFKWKEGTSKDRIENAMKALRSMKSTVPVVQELVVGETFKHERAKGYTHCLIATLANKEDLPVYAEHPAHKEVGTTAVAPILEDVIVLDFECQFTSKL